MADVVVGDEETAEDQPPASAVPPSGDGGKMSLNVTISDLQLPLVMMFSASTVQLIAVMTWKATSIKWREYAISVPSVGMGLAAVGLLMTLKEDLYKEHGKWLNQFLFVWNFIGACFLTFSSPFVFTGNGYFASWATVVTAAMALGFTASAFQTSVKGLGALMGLLASSIIVIIALIDWVGGGIFRAESIYAMVVACITVVLVLAHIYKEKKEGDGDGGGMVTFGVLAFFSVLWLVLACLVSFRGPFIATGNGYFASWAGAACACLACFAAKRNAN